MALQDLEKQINPSDSTCKINRMLNFFSIDFNNSESKLQPYGCRNGVVVINKFDANGVSILGFKKHAFADRVFALMLVYRKQSMHMQEFFLML